MGPEMAIAKKRYAQFKDACEAAGMSVDEFMAEMNGEESPLAEPQAPEEEMEEKEAGEGNPEKAKAMIMLLKKKMGK